MLPLYEITPHAEEELDRRGIHRDLLNSIVNNPQQVTDGYDGRKTFQSIVKMEGDREYLIRIIVDDRVHPLRIITVYRTSSIKKYWKET